MASEKYCAVCKGRVPVNASQCPSCKAWNQFVDSVNEADSFGDKPTLIQLSECLQTGAPRERIRIRLGDECFGGGIALDSLNLVSGYPGAGKSTWLLQLSDFLPTPIIYLATEESGEQVHERCIRLGCDSRKVLIGHPNTPQDIERLILSVPPELPSLIVLDSLQGLIGKDYGMGEDTLKMLKGYAVSHCPVIVTNQVTKTDDFAGPMANQHVVDGTFTLQKLDGPNVALETIKNRNGPAGVRCPLTMTPKGLIPHVGHSDTGGTVI